MKTFASQPGQVTILSGLSSALIQPMVAWSPARTSALCGQGGLPRVVSNVRVLNRDDVEVVLAFRPDLTNRLFALLYSPLKMNTTVTKCLRGQRADGQTSMWHRCICPWGIVGEIF